MCRPANLAPVEFDALPTAREWQLNNRFVYLDFLRFAFAMIVFFGHAQGFIHPEKARLAVDYFFILSGFVLSHAYYEKSNKPGFIKLFVKDRVARLFPLHVVLLVAFMVLNIYFTEMTGQWLENGWSYKDGRTYTLILNFFMLNNVGLSPSSSSWNAPAWSISVEFWINILIAVIVLASRRHALKIMAIACVGSYAVLMSTVGELGNSYFQNIAGWLNVGLLRGLGGMSLGVLCYGAFTLLKGSASRYVPGLKVVALPLLAFEFWMVFYGFNFRFSDFLIPAISALTVLAISLIETQKISSKFDAALEWLGECSYSIYMIHWFILVTINYILNYTFKLDVRMSDPLTFVSVTLLLLIASRASYIYIEKPGKVFIRSIRH